MDLLGLVDTTFTRGGVGGILEGDNGERGGEGGIKLFIESYKIIMNRK